MSDTPYLWRRIVRELRQDLETRRLPAGAKYYSLAEICSKYGVSAITVRRAFNELEQEGLIQKRRFQGTFVRRREAALPVTLVVSEAMLSHPSIIPPRHYFWSEIMRGVSDVAQEHNVSLETRSGLFYRPSLRGLNLIIVDNGDLRREALQDLAAHNTVVFAHGYAPNPWATIVRTDFRKGTLLAIKHLFGLGRRRIGYITGLISNPWLTSRFDGYWTVMHRDRKLWDWDLVAETISDDAEATFAAMQRLLNQRNPPTAIFATNDAKALHVLEYCRMNGIRVPQDLSVIGFDNIPEAAQADPPLTTINTQLHKLGQLAMRTLLRYIARGKKHEDILVAPELVVRASTKVLSRSRVR